MAWSVLSRLFGKSVPPPASPRYSALQAARTWPLPPDLVALEASGEFAARTVALQAQLLLPPDRPEDDGPLFFVLIDGKSGGFASFVLPDGQRCLAIFTSPIKANDYRERLLGDVPDAGFLAVTPRDMLQMLKDVKRTIQQVVVDRCPRCETFTPIDRTSVASVDDVLRLWATAKASELTRAELYITHATGLARQGRLDVARDIALETAGHVTVADPRVHLLLGELGVALPDAALTTEAADWLRQLGYAEWEQALQAAIASGRPTFEPLPD